jgi:hypothetical protein
MSLVVTFGRPSSTCFIFMSPPAAAPLQIIGPGSICTVFVDAAASSIAATPMTSPSGFWSGTFAVPNVPAWAGAQIAVQGIFPGTPAPLGFDLTSARLLVLGY